MIRPFMSLPCGSRPLYLHAEEVACFRGDPANEDKTFLWVRGQEEPFVVDYPPATVKAALEAKL